MSLLGKKLTIAQHVQELRARLVKCALVACACFATCYLQSDRIMLFLLKPLLEAGPRQLIYTGLQEGFVTKLKVGLCGGIVLALPYLMMQLYLFCAPALKKRARTWAKWLILCSMLLAACAFFATHSLVMPWAWGFFDRFNSDSALPVVLNLRLAEYLALTINCMICVAIAFQLPIVLIMGCLLGVVSQASLRKFRKHAIVMIFLISGLLTPNDLISQLVLGVFLSGLYELSVVIASLIR